MRWACEAGVKNCTSYAEKTYQQWLKNPSTVLDVNLKNEILCAGARNANESMWTNILKQIIVSEPDEEIRKEQVVALACSNSTKILKKYLNSTLDPNYPIDFKTAAANVVSRYPGGAQLVFNFVLKQYRRIEKLENFKTIMKDVVTAISGGVTNKEQLLNLTAFFLGRKLDPEDDVLKDAVQNMIWINKYKSTVDEWLGDNSDIFERPDNGANGNRSDFLEEVAAGGAESPSNMKDAGYRQEYTIESAVLHNEATALTRTKINTLMIIIHELSHLWFGNLVTPTWWKYLWVKEGFASYFQYFLASEIAPEFRLDDMFVVESMQENAMVMDGVPEARPLNKDVITPEDVAESYTPMVYDKASSIIRMISHAMTEEVFHKGVKIYLTSHALGNADSNDLFESFQKALNESGIEWKQPMQVLMHNWVECPGYPTVTVKRVHGNYQLTQERLVIALGENQKYPTKWWIPINYVEESNPNFTNTAIVDWFSPNDTSHTQHAANSPTTSVISCNIHYVILVESLMPKADSEAELFCYYRVNYDVENWELLIKELNKGNDTKIHVLNRVQMIDDVFNLAHVDSLNYTIALKVALYLTNEADYMPWQPALRHLGFLRNLLRTSNKYYIFMRYVAHLTKTLTKEIGYEPKANDSDLDKMLRINAMRWACEAGVKSCISYAEKTYQQWLENPLMKLDVNLKTEILCAGVRNANESAWNNTLGHILASTPDEDKRKDQLVALACSNSSEILMTYLNSTLNSGTKVFFSTAARDVVSRYPGGAQLVLNFVIKEQKRIEKS
ncbi:aminopeptidase N-like [Ceratina calcarata]|uniref:glutamyl aminopeptidase n=1 Tax=Ceratina calcarata TaxID=156304 RepID=A0AAJ7S0H5_9HYME|nr:aminopeptidase N-like [Ceratina calcarata]